MALGREPAITDREISEYRGLCTTFGNLHEKFQRRKQEIRKLLEELAARKRDAFIILAKANRLTLHLTGSQRQITGLTYQLSEIKTRINQGSPALLRDVGAEAERENLSELYDCQNRRELKQKGLLLIRMIDSLRKKLLQLDILELRCRELILSINKALQAFRHESRIIRRKIYPFGIFSLSYRALRRFWGAAYFSHRDMEDIAALGSITGYVLKIADSPVM